LHAVKLWQPVCFKGVANTTVLLDLDFEMRETDFCSGQWHDQPQQLLKQEILRNNKQPVRVLCSSASQTCDAQLR
jgi:hypothetical protein